METLVMKAPAMQGTMALLPTRATIISDGMGATTCIRLYSTVTRRFLSRIRTSSLPVISLEAGIGSQDTPGLVVCRIIAP